MPKTRMESSVRKTFLNPQSATGTLKCCFVRIGSQKKIFVKNIKLIDIRIFLTIMKKICKTIIKRYAAIGSPCLAPRFRGKYFEVVPQFMTQLSLPFNKSLTKQINKILAKTMLFKTTNKKSMID